MEHPFKPENSQNIEATTTAQPVALGNYPHVMFVGEGDETVYVKFSKNGADATNEDIPILSGAMLVFEKPDGAEYVSVLAAANTSRFGIIEGRHGT